MGGFAYVHVTVVMPYWHSLDFTRLWLGVLFSFVAVTEAARKRFMCAKGFTGDVSRLGCFFLYGVPPGDLLDAKVSEFGKANSSKRNNRLPVQVHFSELEPRQSWHSRAVRGLSWLRGL